jgi:hypothetical protein
MTKKNPLQQIIKALGDGHASAAEVARKAGLDSSDPGVISAIEKIKEMEHTLSFGCEKNGSNKMNDGELARDPKKNPFYLPDVYDLKLKKMRPRSLGEQ